MRTPRMVALAGLLVVGLAGCLRVDADLSIEGDRVDGTVVTALDQDAARQLELDPDDLFAGETTGLASLSGVATEPYEEPGWTGSRMVFDRVSIDELNQLSEGDPDGLRITREDGRYEFGLVVDFSFLAELDEAQAGLLDSFDVRIAVTFPGEVTEHNGSLSGTTVTWQPPPGERTELRAVALGAGPAGPVPPSVSPGSPGPAPAGSGGSPLSGWWLALGVLGALAAGVGLVAGMFLVNRRNRTAGTGVE